MVFEYDGTYKGFLTVVFEVYERKADPQKIQLKSSSTEFDFGQVLFVSSDEYKAERVLKGLKNKLSANMVNRLYRCFLSEQENIELLLLKFIKLVFSSEVNIEDNYREDCVLRLKQIDKQIGREVHRMHAFVRFQSTKSGIWTALIEPDFNVMPLIGDHFEKRYADQKWLIYDIKRRYGLFYDLIKTEVVEFTESPIKGKRSMPAILLDEEELQFSNLWQTYFKSVNIPERKNIKLHLQHVPKRYWKLLPEKKLSS